MGITTIQVTTGTKKRLEMLKIYPKESMESVLSRLADMAIDDEPLSKEEIAGIRRSLKDIEAGRVHKMRTVAKQMGLK